VISHFSGPREAVSTEPEGSSIEIDTTNAITTRKEKTRGADRKFSNRATAKYVTQHPARLTCQLRPNESLLYTRQDVESEIRPNNVP
jgi:hypothetical protein